MPTDATSTPHGPAQHQPSPRRTTPYRPAPGRPDQQQSVEPERGEAVRFEVITMGRLGVDLYPQQAGVSLREVRTFAKFLGGSAANVAVAAARHGRRTALISRTGDDPFGLFLHDALNGFGVDDRYVTPVGTLPTPVTFCEIFPPDDFPLYFYRYPKAPDLEIFASELDFEAIRRADVFWVTGTGLSQEPSRSATLRALQARGKNGITVFDLDYRPMFWASREEAREWYAQALPYATVAVGNQDEADTAVGVREPRAAARALHDRGVELAVIKQGPRGVLASLAGADGYRIAGAGSGERRIDDAEPGGRRNQRNADGGAGERGGLRFADARGAGAGTDGVREKGLVEVEVPPVLVEVVNGLGAGDAFGGALCHGLLSGWELGETMRFANAAGAIVASRLACADAMPTEAEVVDLRKLAEAAETPGNAEAGRAAGSGGVSENAETGRAAGSGGVAGAAGSRAVGPADV